MATRELWGDRPVNYYITGQSLAGVLREAADLVDELSDDGDDDPCFCEPHLSAFAHHAVWSDAESPEHQLVLSFAGLKEGGPMDGLARSLDRLGVTLQELRSTITTGGK